MPSAIRCPGCQKLFPFDDRLLGQQVRCKACGCLFLVPNRPAAASPASPTPAPTTRPPAPTVATPAAKPAPTAKPSPPADDVPMAIVVPPAAPSAARPSSPVPTATPTAVPAAVVVPAATPTPAAPSQPAGDVPMAIVLPPAVPMAVVLPPAVPVAMPASPTVDVPIAVPVIATPVATPGGWTPGAVMTPPPGVFDASLAMPDLPAAEAAPPPSPLDGPRRRRRPARRTNEDYSSKGFFYERGWSVAVWIWAVGGALIAGAFFGDAAALGHLISGVIAGALAWHRPLALSGRRALTPQERYRGFLWQSPMGPFEWVFLLMLLGMWPSIVFHEIHDSFSPDLTVFRVNAFLVGSSALFVLVILVLRLTQRFGIGGTLGGVYFFFFAFWPVYSFVCGGFATPVFGMVCLSRDWAIVPVPYNIFVRMAPGWGNTLQALGGGSGRSESRGDRESVLESAPTPSFRRFQPGVRVAEVRLGVPADKPGHCDRVRVYLPEGRHFDKSLPCVLIAPAGATTFTGNTLGTGSEPEHLPYVLAGCAVVAYEQDGEAPSGPGGAVRIRDAVEAGKEFVRAKGGLVNAQNAIDYVLKNVPEIDPSRLIAAGHSSAGTMALRLAAGDSRIAACVAYAPPTDFSDDAASIKGELGFFDKGIPAFLRKDAPIANVERIRCPVFLFHSTDDGVVPYDQSQAFVRAMRDEGKSVELRTDSDGNHYDSMIERGIPAGIAWLIQRGFLRGVAPPMPTHGSPDPSAGWSPTPSPTNRPATPGPSEVKASTAWTSHRSPGGEFEVELPDGGAPQFSSIGTTSSTLRASANGAEYVIVCTPMTPEAAKDTALAGRLLETACDAMISKMAQTYRRQPTANEPFLLRGKYLGRRFVIREDSRGVAEGYFIQAGSRMFNLLVIRPDGQSRHPDTIRFVESFEPSGS